jgi:Rieske Fe-S protein
VKRRAFLGVALMLAGTGRRVWAQILQVAQGSSPVGEPRYFPLTRPIEIPLDAVKVPWAPVTFTAEAMAPATATAAPRRVLITGVLFRKGPQSPPPELSALCLTCPHEQCKVDLITEPARLATMSDGTAMHPLFECGCHSSVFDPAEEGARLSGETPRGLYRFRISGVTNGTVQIPEIEEVAVFEV